MAKKILSIPLLILSMVFFMQCSNDALFNESTDVDILAGKGPGGGGPGGGGPGGGGGEEETAGNNLSFPVIRTDGFQIAGTSTMFTVPYAGDFDESYTAEQVAALIAAGPWYPQKTEGNTWQADIGAPEGTVDIDYVDWGDVLESVNPSVMRPTRIEVTLYVITDDDILTEPDTRLTGYTMAVLENPSSPDELQGTNTLTYESLYATVVSQDPKLVVQYFGTSIPADLKWSNNGYWYTGETDVQPGNIIPISFGPELNVGGKYIYGASSGGWKPDKAGEYRLTFYIPGSSSISLGSAVIGNFSTDFVNSDSEGGGASTPVVSTEYNLTYDDVTVITKGGGGRR